MGNDLSIWTLVLDASVIVQAVMVLLMLPPRRAWPLTRTSSSAGASGAR